MVKKKRKVFQKNQLLSLFDNENYQKVISKSKQFKIAGMSDEELHEIKLTSYERLAEVNFKLGDINRALRDVESLLSIDGDDKYKLIKLKYLCYMEHFNDAIVFAQDLINSKEIKIKKEAIFLFLLANIYSGNYEIDEKMVEELPVARVNYILGFIEFLKGNAEEALKFLDNSTPRSKVEKENIRVIKSIILNEDTVSSETIKPLYHFLITAEDRNLQNTKSSRVIKKELLSQFAKKQKNRDIESLISLKSSIEVKAILENISDSDKQIKLIFNNIALLIEKQKNHKKALELFMKYKSKLIKFIESGFLLIQIQSEIDDKKSDSNIRNFLTNYLKLHHKKLSEFQLDFIFIFLLKIPHAQIAIKIIEEYGGEDILFLFRDLLVTKAEPLHQERFNKIMKRYSFLRSDILNKLSDYIDELDKNIDKMGKEKELLATQLPRILILLENVQKPHKNYQTTFFNILSSMARFVQNFEFTKNKNLYIQISNTINNFTEIYNINKADLSKDIKILFTSIEKKKSIKKEKTTDNEENMLDMLKRLMDEYGDEDEDLFGLDQDSLDENDLEDIKQKFISDLKNNYDPFDGKLQVLEDFFYNDTLFEFCLDVTAKAIEFDRYDDDFIQTLFNNIGIESQDSYYRKDLIVTTKIYAKKDIKTALIFLSDCIVSVPNKDRETLWYLEWLEAYVYLVADYNQPEDDIFKGCLYYFIEVQQKKRFKTLNARFRKLVDRFKDKGLF